MSDNHDIFDIFFFVVLTLSQILYTFRTYLSSFSGDVGGGGDFPSGLVWRFFIQT